jgi:CheY-like chemotaxis protein
VYPEKTLRDKMSNVEQRDALNLVISMLKNHEKRLDDISKQVMVLNKAMESEHKYMHEKLEITGKDASKEMKSVLVVDDDPNIVKTYKLVLESVGYGVDTARNGVEAIFKVKKVHYDLVIIDMNLPDMLGNQLADQIRDEKPDIKIIMITGYNSYADKLDDFNIDEMLIKPIPPDDLVDMTKKVLATEKKY